MNPPILAILSEITPKDKQGFVMGLYAATGGMGIIIGAIIVGVLINFSGGWIILFIINPIFALIAFVCFMFALNKCELHSCEPKKGFNGISATFHQLKEALNQKIILLGVIGFLCFFGIIALSSTMNELIRSVFSASKTTRIITIISILMIIGGITGIIMSPVGGLMLKKISPTIMMIMGFLLMSLIFILPFQRTFSTIILVYICVQIGGSIIWPALFKISMEADPEKRGTNSSIINSLRFLGYSLVAPCYFFFGIPGIYYWAFIFILIALIIVIILRLRFE